jgi:hypothetical protein
MNISFAGVECYSLEIEQDWKPDFGTKTDIIDLSGQFVIDR